MKKLVFLLVVILASVSIQLKAQIPLDIGEKMLNFGFGSGVYIGLDYGIYPDITVGGQADFSLVSDRGIGITARGDYHFNTLLRIESKWDVYAGLNLGFWDGPWLAAQIGGRYFWNDRWGVNVEFGGGSGAGGRLGLSMKF